MRIKLDKKCPLCGSRLEFVEEEKDGVYVLCRECRVAVYVPMETATEYVADFPTLIEFMTEELTNMVKKIRQKRGN